jgi:hypothetical protein
VIYLNEYFGDDKWSGIIRLKTDAGMGDPLLELDYYPASDEKETIRISK